MKIVIDTSVLAKIFLDENGRDKANELMSAIGSGDIEAHSPSLLYYELNSVLTQNISSVSEINAHMDAFFELVEIGAITIHEVSQDFLQKVVIVAETDTKGQGNISPYDATFHALALEIGAIFITADNTHYRKTKDVIGSVETLDDFKV